MKHQIPSQFFLCKLCQVGDVVWLVLPSPHACTSLHNFITRCICRRPHSYRQDRKTQKPGCKMCLVMTGYESGYTCYKSPAVVLSLGFCSCLLLWLQRYFPQAGCWVFLTWLIGVKYTVHSSWKCWRSNCSVLLINHFAISPFTSLDTASLVSGMSRPNMTLIPILPYRVNLDENYTCIFSKSAQ